MAGMDQLEALSRVLSEAPFVEGGWLTAMQCYAKLANARIVQFAGWSESSNFLNSRVQPEFIELEATWRGMRGDDPNANPLVAYGMKQPILSPFCDNDAFLELDKDRHPLWREAYVRNDLVHVSITVLSRALDNASFVAVIRSGSQGPFCDEDFKMLTLAGSSWKTSVSVAAAVRSEVACGTTSALHLAHLTGFILDAQGCVRLATASAEVLLQKYVTINRQHRLEIGPPRRDAIQNAVDLCRLTGAPSIIEARISDKNALRFMVSPLPVSRTDFLFGPAILVICKIVRLRPNYTHAESAVADELRSGKSLSEIAVIRHTSLETIKSQSKSIYAKASVSGQIELIMEFIDSGASPINVAI